MRNVSLTSSIEGSGHVEVVKGIGVNTKHFHHVSPRVLVALGPDSSGLTPDRKTCHSRAVDESVGEGCQHLNRCDVAITIDINANVQQVVKICRNIDCRISTGIC